MVRKRFQSRGDVSVRRVSPSITSRGRRLGHRVFNDVGDVYGEVSRKQNPRVKSRNPRVKKKAVPFISRLGANRAELFLSSRGVPHGTKQSGWCQY
jgi:hypothetical protein